MSIFSSFEAEIASAISASNDEKIETNNSAAQRLQMETNGFFQFKIVLNVLVSYFRCF